MNLGVYSHTIAIIMKKILYALILVFSIIQLQSQTLESDIFWLAIESKQISKKGWITPLDGFAFNFGRKESNGTHVFSDSVGTGEFKVRKKKILFNGKLLGKIIHKDQDSLILVVDKKMRVKFIPLKPETKFNISADFWNHLDWTFYTNDFTQHFRLLKESWKWGADEPPKIGLITTIEENYKNSHTEKWNFKIIDDIHLFVKTYSQIEEDIYLVKEYRNDTVVLESLSNPVYQEKNELVKIPSITKSEKDNIANIIKNQLWIGSEFIHKASHLDNEPETDDGSITGFYAIDTLSFQNKSLANKGLSFRFFDNSKYEIYESDTLRLKGNWKISDTGRQIVLNLGCNPEDYIDLIEIKSDDIIIGKIDRFQAGERKRDFIEYYYQLRLTK